MKRMDGGWNNHDESSRFERDETGFQQRYHELLRDAPATDSGPRNNQGGSPALFGSLMKKHHGRPHG
jgi:hypothetical protein